MAMSEADGRMMFSALRPLCVQLMSSPSPDTLQQLREGLTNVLGTKDLHPHIVDYVLLPVRTVINKTGSSNLRLLEEGLVTLAAILSHMKDLESWELFHNILGFLCTVLDKNMAKEAGFLSRSEDLILSTVRALKSLLLCLAPSVRQVFFSNLPVLGHSVSVLLETLQNFQDKTLRRETLSALLALSGVDSSDLVIQLPKQSVSLTPTQDGHSQVGSESRQLRMESGQLGTESGQLGSESKQTVDPSLSTGSVDLSGYLNSLLQTVGVGPSNGGSVFASFLPGVSMAITKLVTTDTNVGSSVTLLALLTWAHYVAMVMNDSQCQEAVGQQTEKQKSTNIHSNYDKVSETGTKVERLGVKRSLSWQQDTDSKLCVLVQRMSGLVTSEGWRVRVGLVGWANCLLTCCYRTLVKCTPTLLETLVTLSNDDYPHVSNSAHFTISSFSKRYSKDEQNVKLTSLLEERVHSLCSSLPRLMRANDDKRKVATLQLLSGYLRLLGPHVVNLTHSHVHLTRMVQALVQTLELQVSDTRIVEHPLISATKPRTNTTLKDTHTTTGHDVAPSQKENSSEVTQQKSDFVSSPEHGGSSSQQTDLHSVRPSVLSDVSLTSASLSLRFKHFREERVETLLCNVCQLLGCYGNLNVVVDHIVDLYRSLAGQRKELLIVMSHVLIGAGGSKEKPPNKLSSKELFLLVEGILQELVEPDRQVRFNNSVPDDEESFETGHAHPQDSVLFSCLLLQTISICGRVLGLTFEPLLQLLAYPLMQKLGDSNSTVSTYARGVVLSVAVNCGYRSIQELISRNADYLVNSTALNLRNPDSLLQHSQAVHVLQAILKHGDASILPLMQDSLDELLFSLDARRQSPAHIWPALRTLSESCLHWSSNHSSLPPDGVGHTHKNTNHVVREVTARNTSEILKNSLNKKREKEIPRDSKPVSAENIKQFFLDYHKQKQVEQESVEEGYKEGEEVNEESLENGDPYVQKQKLPPVSRAAVDLLQRCAHHLSSPTPSVQLSVLEALSHCLLTLKDDQTTLLPEVHNIWSPFLPRLSDSAPPVAMRAWRVMLVMCDVCGDFLRKRVVLKVWPPLTRSLESLATKSLNADRLYKQTTQYKLQQCLLDCVSTLCVKLQVPTPDMESLAHSCIPYLHRDQPLGLQQTCQTCFKNLIAYDPDTIWLLLQQLCPELVATPTNEILKPYKFRSFPASDKYVDNVKVLLSHCV